LDCRSIARAGTARPHPEITRDLLVDHPGFVSAQVYESVDLGAVMIRVAMRTTKDRQAVMDSSDVPQRTA